MLDTRDQSAVPAAYQPPALVVLGSVHELTLGGPGSVMDANGRSTTRNKPK
jgi:hypothetical protein